MVLYRKESTKKGPRPILVELTDIRSVNRESRNICSSKDTTGLFSSAELLTGNPVSRILGNFYLGLNKTRMPVKMFSDNDTAIQWLGTFLTQ
jgi:hypothetical protein